MNELIQILAQYHASFLIKKLNTRLKNNIDIYSVLAKKSH